MKLSIIVAMASNRAIGLNNQIPWRLPADLKHFKAITMGKPVIMGRLTFESIGKPLPGRTNIIISRTPGYRQCGCVVVSTVDNALCVASRQSSEVFVIGGAALYEALLPRADCVYLTMIHKDFSGDTFFPELDSEQWREVAREDVDNDPQSMFGYSFLQLEKQLS